MDDSEAWGAEVRAPPCRGAERPLRSGAVVARVAIEEKGFDEDNGFTGEFCTRRAMVALRRHWTISISILAGLTIFTSACAEDQAQEPGPRAEEQLETVVLSSLNGGSSSIALRVMEEKGFDEKNGFKSDFNYLDPDAATQFFLQEADVAFDLDPVGAAVARVQGHDVTSFYGMAPLDACIVVKEDSDYEVPRDLIGKKVGHFGSDSGTTQSMSIFLSEFEGVNVFDDYNLLESDPAALVDLLDRGEFEAMFNFHPFVTRAIVQGGECIYGPLAEEWKEHEDGTLFIATLTGHVAWLEENPDLAQAVVDAWDEAFQWIMEDPTRITEEPYASLWGMAEEPAVLDLIAEQASLLFASSWTESDQAAAERFIDLAAEQGTLLQENPGGAVSSVEDFQD